MKKMFVLSVLFFCVSLYSVNPVFSQNTGESSAIQANIPYECEEDLIEIMFDENSQVRLRNGSLVDYKSDALTGVDQILEQLDWYNWYRICDVDEDIIDSWSVNGERNTGKPVYNLNNIYRLQIPKGKDIWELCRQLENLPGIYQAKPVPLPVEPPVPPNYQPNQGYLNPASSTPTGIDAAYAWTQTGGTGTGVTVCDLEYSWNYNHNDISKAVGSQINPNPISDPFSDNNHGTAVIGELVADNNGWGTTGICYGAGLKTCGTYWSGSWNVPGAISYAIASLSAGDIILIEQQWDYTGSGGYVPIEWWTNSSPGSQTNNAVYAAIVNAISNGIHVVEAGGNGDINTGLMTWYGNSGAIIVGAGTATTTNDLQRITTTYTGFWGSSYGQRFDLQGWGENVVTTGYGYLYSLEGTNYWYTNTFSGTSSASPVVAGALACAEGYYLANVSPTPPTPAYMRTHLSTYGTPQVFGPSGNIGPRPDLYSAITNFPPPQQNYDWGDAMDPPYPTLAVNNGAYHLIGPLFMGTSVDPEQNGQPTPNADGDDLDGNNDDDGVVFNSVLRPGATVSVTITASATGGLLNAWIDFNGINAWSDPGEQIFTNVTLVAGPNNLIFTVPASSIMGTTTARFRLCTQPGIPFYGQAPDGEVEDYLVFIDEPIPDEYDWGDAPDAPYPTFAASNGANHFMDGITYLGVQVDGEPDGQPDPVAMGDDNDIVYPPPNDDEDGVTFLTPFIQNQTANIDVVASVPGILNAWLDFAQDGSWAQAGDHIFIDTPLNPGINNLNIWIPSGAAVGQTFIRFRFSTIAGLNFDGPAQDGEVEDYEIIIEEGPTDEFDFGDAPEDALAYPSLGIAGSFPTCINVPVAGWIQHNTLELYLGPNFDLENEGNAGICPAFNPNQYNMDECFADSDAGLIIPDGFTIVGPVGSETVQPCTGANNQHLGYTCQNAVWGTDIDIDVHNHMANGNQAYLNLLIDWNQDGQWGGSSNCPGYAVPEHVLVDFPINNPFDGPVSALMAAGTTLPIGPNPGYVWARFTITDIPVGSDWSGEGSFEDGETEDYLLLILEPQDEIDFGDADDPSYPTLLASNGASHIIDGVTFLGASVDAEPDGQPDPNALGDDNDGNDDEDGVTFDWPLAVGNPCKITVNASVANGYFSGWVDFDGNGSWADPGEQVFADIPLVAGNNYLNFTVPLSTTAGSITYARFRFSTQQGLSYDGPANDGEVEDYEVQIEDIGDYKWFQYPDTTLPGLHAHDDATLGYQSIVLADDWLCNGGLVTDIHWWGNYELDAASQEKRGSGIDHFHISIHNQSGAACLPQDPEILGFDIPFSSIAETNTGTTNNENSPIYLYEYILNVPFDQEPGTTYWLDITAFSSDPANPAIWRWQESMRSYYPILCGAADKTDPGILPWSTIQWLPNPPHKYSDMAFIITSKEFEMIDFGDAPDPNYPTLLASNGANHTIEPGFFLGAGVDAEADGQPQGFALGDDNDGNDDEDGVAFTTPLIPGQAASIDVTLADPTGVGGFLDCWIDFDHNGVFDDPAEHLCGGTSCTLSVGVNTINFNVPAAALVGPVTFARFRLSRNGGLPPDGSAPDGEVEDYRVFIVDPGESKMHYPQLPDLTDTGIDVDMFWVPLADDFLCTETGPISEIVMWGSFAEDILPSDGVGSLTFRVTIYSDNPAGTVQPWSMPKDTLWTEIIYPGDYTVELANQGPEWWYDPSTYWWQTANHLLAFKYHFFFSNPFIQQLDSIYWLEIVDLPRPPDPGKDYTFGWKTSDIALRWNDDACTYIQNPTSGTPWVVGWNALKYPPTHDYEGTTLDFAFIIKGPSEIDFGDANDPSYPTLLASNGARHVLDGVTFLGAGVDSEPDGQPDPNALGDDNDGNDDEDGITFTTSLVQGQNANVDIVVSVDGFLSAWLDFNANGSWGDPGEQIATDVPVLAGTNTLTFNVPLTATAGTTYSRFRFSSVSGLGYTGPAPDGEVEDHEVTIEEVPNKWAQYPDTTLPGLHAHDYDTPPYGQIILADDWICEGGWVTDLHWWGNYELDAMNQEIRGAGIDHFHLSIHALDPTGCLPQDPEIWGVDVPFASLTELNTGLVNLEGSSIYLYEYVLNDPFPQIQGEHYWLDITALCIDPVNPAHWRWQEAGRDTTLITCGAAEKTLPNPGVWQTISWANDQYSQMAFVITSEPAPDLDLGDAADPAYPTLLINNGAAHIIDGVTYLGAGVDSEFDGQPDPNALGDDNDGNDDEDGVTINPIFTVTPGGTVWYDIVASVNGTLNIWIDWNANGSWGDAGEHAGIDIALTAGINSVLIPIPANANVGNTYARFRFSSVGGLSFTGMAPDGEVEDHELTIEGDLDFGDAPDQAFPAYPTLLANNGARHLIDPTIYLGYGIDPETDGQPTGDAMGDDNDGNDDEDGIIIPPVLSHGSMNSITVIASANGYLNGWIDFNSSGDWAEADEHVLIDQSVTAGTQTFNIIIPSTSVKGTSYARFRFSTVPGLSYVGQAPDGEVEDYQVEIGEPEKWLQQPDLSILGMDVDATIDNILADDFLCTTTGPITRIEIWGSWQYDHIPFYEDPGAVSFTLSIHEDIPADQSPTGHSMPGDVIWWKTFDQLEFMFEPYALNLEEGWYNPSTGFYLPFGDTECWKYIFELDNDEFIQQGTADEPKIYWLDVQAQPFDQDPDCRFGWKTSVDHWNDDAVWTIGSEPYLGDWFELMYPDGHPLYPESIDLAFALYGLENPYVLVDLTAFLEGPFSGSEMKTTLNSTNLLPLNQPYASDPTAKWYYTGTESVGSIPNTDIVDWVMVELRDATSASSATGTTMIDEKAAFIKKDGKIVATDGSGMMKFYVSFSNNPYAVVWHRNHLGILSANPLNLMGLGLYRYDFTTGSGQAYLNGQKDLGGGIYGMMGGDGQPDGSVDNNDQINVWAPAAGTTGYQMGDYNMDTQVDNKDKNDVWYLNIGSGTQVPN